jgi:uncharacterized protein YjbI with pentapeptide repeats
VSDQELKRILADHALWLAKNGGNRANLSGANLRGANLSDADLSRADLCGVDLRGANLSGANLSGAYLSWADLSCADLCGVDLRWANLSDANLREAIGLHYAQCSFFAHGERGRQLSGVVIAGELRLFCGCFAGTLAELDAYIANGDERYKATRKLARDFIVAAIDSARKEAQP